MWMIECIPCKAIITFSSFCSKHLEKTSWNSGSLWPNRVWTSGNHRCLAVCKKLFIAVLWFHWIQWFTGKHYIFYTFAFALIVCWKRADTWYTWTYISCRCVASSALEQKRVCVCHGAKTTIGQEVPSWIYHIDAYMLRVSQSQQWVNNLFIFMEGTRF